MSAPTFSTTYGGNWMHAITCLTKKIVRGLAPAAILLAALAPAQAVTVWTHSYNNQRTGANTSETTLTTSNVNVNSFGKLFTCPVDGQLYAEPLYIPGVSISGGTHNVVYCCSMENSVYAFDADTGALYWHTNYGTPVPANNVQCCCPDIVGDIGILSTPVIDTTTNTIYLVHRNLINGVYSQTLRALDITTGADKFGSPVAIAATYGGVSMDPKLNNQRAALTLSNGVVYISGRPVTTAATTTALWWDTRRRLSALRNTFGRTPRAPATRAASGWPDRASTSIPAAICIWRRATASTTEPLTSARPS
jgi:hypothetical protein